MNQITLIADSGSTKTDWVLISETGQTLASCSTKGINPFYLDKNEVLFILTTDVAPILSVIPTHIYFYGAGCADSHSSQPVTDALRESFPNTNIIVASDILGAARGSLIREKGIACILGTGANNCLYDGNQIIGNIGSLGFWMGDEGSGGNLGKRLIIAYLHKELPNDLETLFDKSFPEVDRLYILDKAYKQAFPNRYFATYAKFISQNSSHPYLVGLVRAAFQDFTEKYILKHPKQEQIAFVGSVAWHFKNILEETMRENNLPIPHIVKSPMAGLIQYHTQ